MEPLILPRNCGNCRFFDGEGWCALPATQVKLLAGYVVAPDKVVCEKHQEKEAES